MAYVKCVVVTFIRSESLSFKKRKVVQFLAFEQNISSQLSFEDSSRDRASAMATNHWWCCAPLFTVSSLSPGQPSSSGPFHQRCFFLTCVTNKLQPQDNRSPQCTVKEAICIHKCIAHHFKAQPWNAFSMTCPRLYILLIEINEGRMDVPIPIDVEGGSEWG